VPDFGAGSASAFINDGVATPVSTEYWIDNEDHNPANGHAQLTLEPFAVLPSSISIQIRSSGDINFNNPQLWYYQLQNSGLAQTKVLIASGDNTYIPDASQFETTTINLTVNHDTKPIWRTFSLDGYPEIVFDLTTPSNSINTKFDELNVVASGESFVDLNDNIPLYISGPISVTDSGTPLCLCSNSGEYNACLALASQDRVRFVRDILEHDEDGYVDQNHNFRSHTNSLYEKIDVDVNADAANEYMQTTTSSAVTALFKIEKTNRIPDRITVKVSGVNTTSSATTDFWLNEKFLTTVDFDEGITTRHIDLTDGTRDDIFRLLDFNCYPTSADNGNVKSRYESLRIDFPASSGTRLNAVEIYYSGGQFRNNHFNSMQYETEVYPSGLIGHCGDWRNDVAAVVSASDIGRVSHPVSGVDTDTEYLQLNSFGVSSAKKTDYLSLYFGALQGSGNYTRIGRAILNMRMNVPTSGVNLRDEFEVYGISHCIKSYYAGVGKKLHIAPELYGLGQIVEYSGFKNYTCELNWYNPLHQAFQPTPWGDGSGTQQRRHHDVIEAFRDLELKVIGLPSGVQVSATHLNVHYAEDDTMGLNVFGHTFACQKEITPSGGGNAYWTLRGSGDDFGKQSLDNIYDVGYWPINEYQGKIVNSTNGATSGILTHDYFPGFSGVWGDQFRESHGPIYGPTGTLSSGTFGEAYIDFSERVVIPNPTNYFVMLRVAPSGGKTPQNETILYRGFPSQAELQVSLLDDTILIGGYDDLLNPITLTSSASAIDIYTTTIVLVFDEDSIDIWTDGGSPANGFLQNKGSVSFPNNRYINNPNPKMTVGGVPSGYPTLFSNNSFGGWITDFGIGSGNPISATTPELSGTVMQTVNTAQYVGDVVTTAAECSGDSSFIRWILPSGNTKADVTGYTAYNTNIIKNIDNLYAIGGTDSILYNTLQLSPSSIWMDVCVEHTTNHVSGVKFDGAVIFEDAGGFPINFAEFSTFFPSGEKQVYRLYNSNDIGEILASEIHDNDLTVDLQYNQDGNENYFGDLKLFSYNVGFDALCIPATGTGSMPLFTLGDFDDNELDLFIKNRGAAENLDLFIDGSLASNDNMPLHVLGGVHVNNGPSGVPVYISGSILNEFIPLYTLAGTKFDDTTLYINGAPISGSIPLYIKGGLYDNASMNLYSSGLTPLESSGDISLFMWSTTNSGVFNTTPLHIGISGTPDPDYQLNLVMQGDASSDLTSNMNLFLENDNSVNDNIPLFLQNDYVLESGNIPLFMAAPSGTLGAVPFNDNMNLFINRQFNGVHHRVSLHLLAQSGENNNMNLFVEGGESGVNNNMPLVMPNILESQPSGSMELYTHGF